MQHNIYLHKDIGNIKPEIKIFIDFFNLDDVKEYLLIFQAFRNVEILYKVL
jgi:hypothetical protein